MSNIILANYSHFDKIKNLMLTALKEDPYGFSVTFDEYNRNSLLWWDGYIRTYFSERRDKMYLIEEGNEMIGMIGLLYDNKIRKNHSASIVWFYINKNFRGKGFGRKLLKKVFSDLKNEKEVKKLTLFVNEKQDSAIHLYKSLGFEIAGVLKGDLNFDGELVDTIIMELYKFE